jgi:hypothetical protein
MCLMVVKLPFGAAYVALFDFTILREVDKFDFPCPGFRIAKAQN